MFRTKRGIVYDAKESYTAEGIKSEALADYFKKVAQCHMDNYGRVYVDEYGHPIDNEYDLPEVHEDYERHKS